LKLKEPNIFKVLGIDNYEIRHSNFLGWLLNPNDTHGLNNYFLNRFLQDVLLDDRAVGVSVVEVPSIDNKKVEIRREWKNIDLLINTENFVVCIENKIWSSENSGQLKKYKRIIENEFPTKKHIFVFLSPYGDEASLKNIYINYSYERIIDILESMLNSSSLYLNKSVSGYIRDYLTILKQNLMGNDNVNSLAEELYKNHQELFDFVFQNKPDHRSYLTEKLQNFIKKKEWVEGSKNKNYVRFTTSSLTGFLPAYEIQNGGWKGKEPLLFEFILWSDSYIYFQVAVSPGNKQESIKDWLDEFENSTMIGKKTWSTFFQRKLSFNYQTINDLKNKEFDDELKQFLVDVNEIVLTVEKKIKSKIENI
jgi:hypothetical protein